MINQLVLGLLFFLIALLPNWNLIAQIKREVARPNILLIMTDDQGWGDIRSHGNPLIDTPVLDHLAEQGTRFDRFFVSPVCAPTRASLLTGRWHLRTGTHGVTRGNETMRSEEVTLAEILRQQGYHTGIFGKWHNGAHYPEHPNGQGFEEFIGFCSGHLNNYFDATLEYNGKPIKSKGYITDVLTDAAIEFIVKNKTQPFFCYLPYNAPHSPFQVPDRYFQKYKNRGLDDQNAAVYGMVENVDDNVGRILTTLREHQLENATIIIFLSDNGPNGQRYNGGMRGIKGSVHEGGVRVPFFIRWSDHLPGGQVVTSLAAHVDVLPTLVELAGLELPRNLLLDGQSLVPLLRQTVSKTQERCLFSHWSGTINVNTFPGSVRTARWRLVNTNHGWELYDMIQDPGQVRDLAPNYSEVVTDLSQRYQSWFQDVIQAGFSRIPIQVGHPQSPVVDLPGHEATLFPAFGQGIGYFEKNGWANDWVTNWSEESSYAEWPVQVVDSGVYRISLFYSCSAANVGSTFRLEFESRVLDGVVSRPFDAPQQPSPDRVPRKEVYEREWGELVVGDIHLEPGISSVRIRPVRIAKDNLMDLKALRIQKLSE